MHLERFKRTKLASLVGAIACLLLLALAAHSGLLLGQAAKNAQNASPQAAQNRPSDQTSEMQTPANSQDDADDADDPSPGNFLGSTYVPSILDPSQPAGNGGPLMAAAPPPPKPVPADAGGDAGRQQVNNETANLLAMVYALKAEVDRSNKDELSMAVVRKAGQVEQLARKVRDDMRPVLSSKN